MSKVQVNKKRELITVDVDNDSEWIDKIDFSNSDVISKLCDTYRLLQSKLVEVTVEEAN